MSAEAAFEVAPARAEDADLAAAEALEAGVTGMGTMGVGDKVPD